MKKYLEIGHSILTEIIWIIIPIVAFTVLTSKTPMLFGLRSYVVMTGSMEPTIPTGSILYTFPSNNYQNGDIIAFDNGKVTVTHRVIKVQDQSGKKISPLVSPILDNTQNSSSISFKTQGDANKTPDDHLVTKDKVLGKALFHFPFVGKLVMSLKTPVGFILFMIIPTLGFIVLELLNIKKEIIKQTERKVMEKLGAL